MAAFKNFAFLHANYVTKFREIPSVKNNAKRIRVSCF